MPDYTVVKLLELENRASGTGTEFRMARDAMQSRHIGVSLWQLPADYQSNRGHAHREQEEAYLVIAGGGRMLLDGETIDLEQWDLVRVSPETVRAFAAGPDGMQVVAIGGPKPEGGDGVPGDVSWPD
jgi:quercetin dioxygenase-like cupin family protein